MFCCYASYKSALKTHCPSTTVSNDNLIKNDGKVYHEMGCCFDPDVCSGDKCIQDLEIHTSCSNEEPSNLVAWTVKASLLL